ncbi:unnamed protein product [Rodentolepis nana]|uniref:Protein kinase domain-containing protein n=1 Tax=Rodentolepis nana TaxID=102285 RepID=A0A0R3T401_RODNA|nr:unnamed protein product [Rodentolepis nana]
MKLVPPGYAKQGPFVTKIIYYIPLTEEPTQNEGEQRNYSDREYDGSRAVKADVWALGISLVYMLTGKVIFYLYFDSSSYFLTD